MTFQKERRDGSEVLLALHAQFERGDEFGFLTRTCSSCFNTVLSSRDERVLASLESLRIPAALVARDQTVLISNKPRH